MRPPPMILSVIIPAYNEERYLPATLRAVQRAKSHSADEVEVMVIDNGSTDATATVARSEEVRVVYEPLHNVGRARNSGVASASGALLIFLDADTLVPERLFARIIEVMEDPDCFGGAVDTDYQPTRRWVRVYLGLWRILGRAMGMAQGATQFCRRSAFSSLAGYDEAIHMGEDVDFYWRLSRLAKRHGGYVTFISDLQVIPSTRRFDQWPFWRILIWTNPLFVWIFRRRKSMWRGWYEELVR